VRQRITKQMVWLVSIIIAVSCVLWGVLVQFLVPNACTYAVPPPNAQYLHCP
jgi:hypothetical protein